MFRLVIYCIYYYFYKAQIFSETFAKRWHGFGGKKILTKNQSYGKYLQPLPLADIP